VHLTAALLVAQVDPVLLGGCQSSSRSWAFFEGHIAETARAAAVVRDERVDNLAVQLKGLPKHLRRRTRRQVFMQV
jgi:hypothetical protein